MIENSYNNKRVQKGVQQMLAQHDWDYFVTANFNEDRVRWSARKTLENWHRKTNKTLIGAGWQRRRAKHILTVAFCENMEGNAHWHLLVKVKEGRQNLFEIMGEALWKKIVCSGTMDIRKLATKDDVIRTSSYCAKGLWDNSKIGDYIISTEFY